VRKLVVGKHARDVVGEGVGDCRYRHGGRSNCDYSDANWRIGSQDGQGPIYFKMARPQNCRSVYGLPCSCMWGTKKLGQGGCPVS
jgi:hypothetical protein